MARNDNFSRKITITSQFDVSGILTGLKEIQSVLNGMNFGGAATKKEISKIDDDISKIERLATKMQTQIQRGFSSNKEVDAFTADMEKIIGSTQTIYNNLKRVQDISLEDKAKSLDKFLKDAGKEVERIKKSLTQGIPRGTDSNFRQAMRSAIDNEVETEKRIALIDQEIERIQRLRQARIEEAKEGYVSQTIAGQSFATEGPKKNTINKAFQTALTDFAKNGGSATSVWEKLVELTAKENIQLKETESGMQTVQKAVEAVEAAKNQAGLLTATNVGTQTWVDQEAQKSIVSQSQTITGLEEYRSRVERTAVAVQNLRQQQQEFVQTNAQEQASLRDLTSQIDSQNDGLNRQITLWDALVVELQSAAARQTRIDNGFNALITRLTYLFSFTSLFYQLRNQIRNTYNDVKTLDKAFAEIAMVTDKTLSGLWSTYDDYAKMANKLGQSTVDVVKASALYYQQGLDTVDALKLTEDTMKLATLASADFTEATDLMTAALRGFKMEMDEGAHITDVYSELAAHAAANVQEIAVAMNKTAAIANSAGMAFETTAAFLTQMIESTQESATNIGTAMKTVIARFTELKENVDESDEDFEDIEYNKIDKALKSIGISLKDTNGQFRDLDKVFLELAGRWGSLSRNTQRYIATIAAGSRLNANPLPLAA